MTVDTAHDWAHLLASEQVLRLVELALQEDIGTGDLTTQAIFAHPKPTVAHLVARTATVVCGLPLMTHILHRLDAQAQVTPHVDEGAAVAAGTTLCRIDADIRALLTAERTCLNFCMRLCGIAQAAARAVQAIGPGLPARVFDTRKTMPGWRLLDKMAVHTGGAQNHRMGLFDAVLIKDNHVAACGSVGAAVALARAHVGLSCAVEVEVDSLAQLDDAVQALPDIILLDNFSLDDLRTAVQRVAGRIPLEASGGVTLATLPAVAQTGVERISLGALTHSALPADLSLELPA